MRPYEIMLLVNPDLEDPKEEVSNVEEVVRSHGGNISKTDIWGKKRLAYPLNKHTEGFYALINAEIEPETISELERLFKIRDDIWRHIIIRTDEA